MKLKHLFIGAAATVLGLASVNAQVTLIGGAVGNGDFQGNMNNFLLTDAQGWGMTTSTGSNGVSNSLGRAFFANSAIGQSINLVDWTGTRTAYPGGNNAWGLDAANSAFGSPNVYWFMNSGGATLTHTTINGTFNAGDVFQVTLDLFQNGGASAAANVTPTITFNTTETHTFGTATVSAVSTVLNYSSAGYTLLAPATGVTLTLAFSTGISGAQTLMDNVTLTVTPVPEPTTFALAGLGLAWLLIFRRRR